MSQYESCCRLRSRKEGRNFAARWQAVAVSNGGQRQCCWFERTERRFWGKPRDESLEMRKGGDEVTSKAHKGGVALVCFDEGSLRACSQSVGARSKQRDLGS